MEENTPQMQPWDEKPKRAALNAAANLLYNSQLAGRPGSPIHEQIAQYSDEGAEEILLTNFRRGIDEDRTLAARLSRIHWSETNTFGFLFSDSIHGSGQAVPANHMVHPVITPTLALSVQEPLERPDVNAAQILASCRSVFFGVLLYSQRSDLFDSVSRLECQADNTQAAHLVIAPRHVSVLDFDFASHAASLEITGQVNYSLPSTTTSPTNALAHLTESVRKSIATFGPVSPKELLVLPSSVIPIEFPLKSTASAHSKTFGKIEVLHDAPEFEEGFIPMNKVREAEADQ